MLLHEGGTVEINITSRKRQFCSEAFEMHIKMQTRVHSFDLCNIRGDFML